ncbi:MAG: hypothetical protein HQM13_08875 [SAR324 cluster bacterium]|nr:hypothetical protein [SAR324 cluster bacterium]
MRTLPAPLDLLIGMKTVLTFAGMQINSWCHEIIVTKSPDGDDGELGLY